MYNPIIAKESLIILTRLKGGGNAAFAGKTRLAGKGRL